MNIKLHQLKCFTTVAETGSFSAASRKIGIAQPALSRKIAELEEEVQKPLFRRSSKGVALTEAGEKFLRHARLILLQLARAEREMALDDNGAADEVTLLIAPALSLFVAAPLVKAVATDFPNIRVLCHETQWDEARARMESGRADLALVTSGHLFTGVEVERCVVDRLYFGGRIDDTHHGSQPITLEEICEQPLIMPGRDYLIRRTLDETAAGHGLKLNIVHEVNSGQLLSTYLDEGLGFTLSIWQTFFEGVARGQMFARPLTRPSLERMLTIVSQPGTSARPAVATVHSYLRMKVLELYRAGILRGDLAMG